MICLVQFKQLCKDWERLFRRFANGFLIPRRVTVVSCKEVTPADSPEFLSFRVPSALERRTFCQGDVPEMFLLVALSEILLLWGWMCRSEGLCSPTRFYKNCWIRQFPGLSLDLEHSQQQGAQILKVYVAPTAGQCSRACCILRDGKELFSSGTTRGTPHDKVLASWCINMTKYQPLGVSTFNIFLF